MQRRVFSTSTRALPSIDPFQNRSTAELARGALVFQASSVTWLTNNALKLIDTSDRVIGRGFTDALLKVLPRQPPLAV